MKNIILKKYLLTASFFVVIMTASFYSNSILINVVNATDSSSAGSKSCEKYKDKGDTDYDAYCSNIVESCKQYDPSDKSQNIIKIQMIPFVPAVTNSSGSKQDLSADPYGETYKTYLQEVNKKNPPYLGTRPLEQAKVIYIETQNVIYNCAVLNVKLKVGENILKLVGNNDTSNTKEKITSQNNTIKNEMSDKGCNNPGDISASFKEILLNNITFHYCNYRFYLDYLSNVFMYNVAMSPISDAVLSPGQDKYNTANLSNNLKKQGNLVSSEIKHTKQVYNLSFSAFSELENTYGLHIMLLLIYDDYVKIRGNLSKVLNPISQLVYKIPQAQAK